MLNAVIWNPTNYVFEFVFTQINAVSSFALKIIRNLSTLFQPKPFINPSELTKLLVACARNLIRGDIDGSLGKIIDIAESIKDETAREKCLDDLRNLATSSLDQKKVNQHLETFFEMGDFEMGISFFIKLIKESEEMEDKIDYLEILIKLCIDYEAPDLWFYSLFSSLKSELKKILESSFSQCATEIITAALSSRTPSNNLFIVWNNFNTMIQNCRKSLAISVSFLHRLEESEARRSLLERANFFIASSH